jgi:chromosome segregation ATPase
MEQINYDNEKAREFFKHIVKAYDRYEEKNKAKEKLGKHIEKIKILSLDKKTSKKRIEDEFKQLEQQIADVVALEKGIITRKDYKEVSKEVKTRILALERKLERYTQLIEGRREKIRKLEKKIKEKATELPIIPIKRPKLSLNEDLTIKLRNQLYDLEEKYHDLKVDGYPEKDLKKIKDKIKKLKQKI